MREGDIIKTLTEQGTGGSHVIAWWRKEEDWLEYELVDHFMANPVSHGTQEIEGFRLVSDEELWDEAKRRCGSRLERNGEQIRWEHEGKSFTCHYGPDSLLRVLDIETRGNMVD